MKQVLWCLVCVVLMSQWSVAYAQAPERPVVGVQLGVGAAKFIGDLTNDVAAPVFDLQIETLFVKGTNLAGYLAIDALTLSTTNGTRSFPFEPNTDLTVRAFLFIPHLCWVAHERVWWCGGIGQGTVNVNADGDRRDYGTWNYQSVLKFFPVEHWSIVALVKYVGEVEQQVQGVDSQFSFLMGGIAAAWMW